MSALNRRQFIGGVGSAAVLAPLPALSITWQLGAVKASAYGVRAVYQQQMFVDYSGLADRYTPPQGNASTRAYRASLTDEEFLRRHWFS